MVSGSGGRVLLVQYFNKVLKFKPDRHFGVQLYTDCLPRNELLVSVTEDI